MSEIRITRIDGVDASEQTCWTFDASETIRIGRSSDCNVHVAHNEVSRSHAIVFFDDGNWVVSCVGQNGTFENGERVEHAELSTSRVLEFAPQGPQLLFEVSDEGFTDDETGEISQLLAKLSDGDSQAAEELWKHCFDRVSQIARNRLSPAFRRVTDEEDVAVSVMESLFRGVTDGKYPELKTRDGLWRLLFTMTARKAINSVAAQKAQKRGGGKVRGESIFIAADGHSGGFDRFAGGTGAPSVIAMVTEEAERMLTSLNDETLERVAALKLEGYSNMEIATELQCNVRTVERHLQRIRGLWANRAAGHNS